jgi:penicillin-binding protein 2
MVPRRNPEIVIAVLQEHGDWGSNSAKIAVQIITTYVNKKRKQDKNVLDQAAVDKPVEVGAVWSDPAPAGRKKSTARSPMEASVMHAGHFFLDPPRTTPPTATASSLFHLPAWFMASPLRFRERHP